MTRLKAASPTEPDRAVHLAVDLGGSSMRTAAVREGWVLRGPEVHRVAVDRATTLDDVVDGVRGACDGHFIGARGRRVGRVVVAVPTFVEEDGRLADCPSLPRLTGTGLGEALRRSLVAEQVDVVPDLAAAALGESRFGCGRGVRRLLVVALGTGANAAAVVDGRLVETAYGCLGDAGHVVVEPDGPECACGGRGCLEAVASGWALARDAAAGGLPIGEGLTVAAREGDPAARALLERAGRALGRAVSTWSVMLFPDLVAVAGGVAGAGELLLAPARAEFRRLAPPYVERRTSLVPAALGDGATLAGAAWLASAAGLAGGD